MVLAASALVAAAQTPAGTSMCDYYTTALLKNNSASNQLALLTVLVNTAVIGNYSTLGSPGFAVPGILAPGEYMGVPVNLLPFFDGTSGATTNTGTGPNQVAGVNAVATSGVNFLDGGGAAPLMKNLPANDVTTNQYGLMTHLYEFFGILLGCSMQSSNNASPTVPTNSAYPFGDVTDGGNGFNSYQGDPSMYDVHRFMNLTAADLGYFIEQVALAAESLGVAATDVDMVGVALATTFTELCSPPVALVAGVPAQVQAICNDVTCSKSVVNSCNAYPDAADVGATFAMSAATSTANTTQSFGQSLMTARATITSSTPASSHAANLLICNVVDPTRRESPWHGNTAAHPQVYDPSMYVCVDMNFLCPVEAPLRCGYACYNSNQYTCVNNMLML